ncbi:hypothetical protein [Kitasatospora sp. NPDC002040]|uniref:hypothetical protein n=1 Tax=Kitasatospora sp. NPDC002040 TaxID=3154661 RepID=UPI003318F31B
MAELADAFVGAVPELTQDQRRHVLSTLEGVLCEGGEDDVAAVATGFLEALLNAWDNGFELRLVWDDLGLQSQSHCLAWNKFWGVKSLEWIRRS